MAYAFLLAAISLEVLGTSLLNATDGFSRLWPSAACLAAYAGSFFALAQTVKDIPVGVTYAMWAGLGTAAIVAIGVVALGESLSATKILGVLLVIGGVVVLNLGGAH
ncbi:DMT family transporter [Solicola gregarius]|uniref:Multidrug efflux SMR transporter n=1 Tax=Solicola gregarius TaxID=2908642 RepID=A0AA46TGA5_9ACTN|nr:multidrug efflux SMR transporter [Solicola gregarius]UYM04720.1 multidrug efflux SMR transporter [Solicola gregarius]